MGFKLPELFSVVGVATDDDRGGGCEGGWRGNEFRDSEEAAIDFGTHLIINLY